MSARQRLSPSRLTEFTVPCPAGKRAITGGWHSDTQVIVQSNFPAPDNRGWSFAAHPADGATLSELTVFVGCVVASEAAQVPTPVTVVKRKVSPLR